MILDVSVGIISAALTSWFFGIPLSLTLVILGIFFALLPDIDVTWGLFIRNKRWWEKGMWGHREFTHYPIAHIIMSVLVYIAAGGMWAFLYIICVFAHLIHDSIQDGWGIKWLWPINKAPYELYIRRYGRHDWFVKKDWQLQGEYLGKRSQADWIIKEYLGRVLKWEVLALVSSLIALYFYAK